MLDFVYLLKGRTKTCSTYLACPIKFGSVIFAVIPPSQENFAGEGFSRDQTSPVKGNVWSIEEEIHL